MAQQDFTDEDIEKKIDCAATMASSGEGLKVITYAYKDLAVSALNDLMLNHHSESEEFREELERDLVYLTTFALEDPLRAEVVDCIQRVRYGRLIPPGESREGVS